MKKIINKTSFNKTSFNKTCFKKILNLILLVSTIGFSVNAQNAGLQNFGASCYMNAGIQCLANVKELSNGLTANKARLEPNSISLHLANLMEELNKPAIGVIEPRNFSVKQRQEFFQNSPGMQDSAEFLTQLLDRLPPEAQDIFTTKINIAPEHIQFCATAYLASLDKSPKILRLQNQFSFDEGIYNFFDNEGIKKVIYKLPNILVIRLGREKETPLGFQKDNKVIPFKLNLNLEQYLINPMLRPAEYNLVGIICHSGLSFNAGHYYSYVKDSENKNWYRYDDAKVAPVDLEEIKKIAEAGIVSPNNTPYILFYQLKKNAIGAGPPQEQRLVVQEHEAGAPAPRVEDELAKAIRLSLEAQKEDEDARRIAREKEETKRKEQEADRKQQEETERLAQLEQERVRREHGAQHEEQRQRLAEQQRQQELERAEQQRVQELERERIRREQEKADRRLAEQLQRQEEEQRRLAEQRRQEEQRQLLAEQQEQERLARIAAQAQPAVEARPAEAEVKKEFVKINDPEIKSRLKQLNDLFNRKAAPTPQKNRLFVLIKQQLLQKYNINLKEQELDKETMDYLNSIID